MAKGGILALLTINLIFIVNSSILEFNTIKKIRRTNKRYTNNINNNFRLLGTKQIDIEFENQEDYYIIAIGIGTPAQYFPVQIDSTTAYTWAPSVKAKNSNISSSYNPVDSNSSQTLANKTIKIWDEDGSVQGTWTIDNIKTNNLFTSDFSFVTVDKYESNFDDHPDGKLGLGYNVDGSSEFSILKALQNSGAIDKKIFAISQTNETHGLFYIGGYPNNTNSRFSHCNITIKEDLSIYYKDGWICKITHIMMGKNGLNFTEATEASGMVVFDSAYSYISVPVQYLADFKEYFMKNNITDCKELKCYDDICLVCPSISNFDSLDQLSFIIDGKAYYIPFTSLFEDLNNKDSEFYVRFNKFDLWNLGHPFMDQYTVVFNGEKNKVGFAGGNIMDYTKEWDSWQVLSKIPKNIFTEKEFQYLMITFAVLGFLLMILILFICVRAIRRGMTSSHGPLIEDK